MSSHNHFKILAVSVITISVLLFSGCGSTDSDTEDPGNGNGNNSNSVSFSSGDIPPGESYSYTFSEEGEVEYYCQIHAPDMQGKITVSNSTEAVERDTVSMESDQFNPQELSIAPNTEVVWINNENHAHNILTGNPSSDGNDSGNPGY